MNKVKGVVLLGALLLSVGISARAQTRVNAAEVQLRAQQTASLSQSGFGKIYFDRTLGVFRVSENGGAYANLVGGGGGGTTINPGDTFIPYRLNATTFADSPIARSGAGAITVAGTIVQTSASAAAFESGPNGSTNPVLRLVNSTASSATGLSITGAASGAGITLTALGGAAESIILAPKGTGAVLVNTGLIQLLGTTASFPALKRSSTSLHVRLADDSDFTGLVAARIYLTTTAGAQYQFVADPAVILGANVPSNGFYGFSSTTSAAVSPDAALARNGVPAQIQVTNGTVNQWGSLFAGVRDAGTATVVNGVTIGHQSTGTPAAGLGIATQFNLNSSTTADQPAGSIYSAWETATHASRRSYTGIQSVGHLQTQVDSAIHGATLAPTNNTVTTATNVTVASNSVAALVFSYGVEVFDGTNLQVEEGFVSCHVINKAGVFSNNVCLKSGNQQALGSGTLTVTWTITAANPALIQVNANSSLTPSAGYPRVVYHLFNQSSQALAVQ
jgi:hypothetical protein